MALQTSISFNASNGLPGQIADGSLSDKLSARSAAAQTPGRFVCFDEASVSGNEFFVRLPADAGDVAQGGGIVGQIVANEGSTHPANQPFEVVVKGHVWVTTTTNCAPGDKVYARHTADANPVGSLGNTDDSSEAAEIVGARFLTKATAGNLAMVSIG